MTNDKLAKATAAQTLADIANLKSNEAWLRYYLPRLDKLVATQANKVLSDPLEERELLIEKRVYLALKAARAMIDQDEAGARSTLGTPVDERP